MKRIPLLCFFVFLTYSIQAQNLVPNYSFENYIACISQLDEFNGYVTDWTGQEAAGILSYCTANCSDTFPKYYSAGVPYNYVGFQHAHTGSAYVIMATFENGSTTDTTFPYSKTGIYNMRNYIQAKLIDSLKVGVRYYVTFYTSLGDSSVYACSDMGAYLSDSALNLSGDSVKYYLIPQVANDPKKQELSGTMNWMKISGSFIAKGGEKYIIIGNFKNDSLSSIRYLGPSYSPFTAAYYYIDDVIVSPDSSYADSISAIGELKVESEKLKVFPNPSNGVFTVESSVVSHQLSVEVYNELGQKIFSQFSTFNSQFSINLSNQPLGIYLYRVITEQGELVGSGKLIIK
jgi:OOP family OmpA-OmpF porin